MYVPTSTHLKINLGAAHDYVNCELTSKILTLKNLVNNLKINTSQVCFLYFILQWCKLNLIYHYKLVLLILSLIQRNKKTPPKTKQLLCINKEPNNKIWLS